MPNINAQTIINEAMAALINAPAESWETITIKTSAKGIHKVRNDKPHLERFIDLVRKNAAAFGGGLAKIQRAKPAKVWPAGAMSMVKQLIEDGDHAGALQLATEQCGAVFYKHQKEAYMMIGPVECTEIPGTMSAMHEDGTYVVYEPVSGFAVGTGSLSKKHRSRKAAIEASAAFWNSKSEDTQSEALRKATATPNNQDSARITWQIEHGTMDAADIEVRIEQQAAHDVDAVVASATAAAAIESASESAALETIGADVHHVESADQAQQESSEARELATADACATVAEHSSADHSGAPGMHGSATSSRQASSAAPTLRGEWLATKSTNRIDSKSGQWSAWFWTTGDGTIAMGFSAHGGTVDLETYATGSERMRALQQLARAIDDAYKADQARSAATKRDLRDFDVMQASAQDVQNLSAAEYSDLCEYLEDINFHAENVVLSALRAGLEDLASEARSMVHQLHKEGGASWELIEQRRALMARIDAAAQLAIDQGAWFPPAPAPGAAGDTLATTAPESSSAADTPSDTGADYTTPRETSSDEGSGLHDTPRDLEPEEVPECFKKSELLAMDLRAAMAAGVPISAFVGMGVRYTGDMANHPGDGAIVSAEPCTWAGVRVVVQLEDGRSITATGAQFGDKPGDRLRLNLKMHGAPYLAQLAAAVAASKAAKTSAEELEKQAFEADLVRLAAEFPQLKRAEKHNCTGKLAAVNIRTMLKGAFKGIKFSVTSDYNSVRVSWTDGPSVAHVDEVIGMFDIGAADYNTDYFYTVKTAFSELFGGVQYLSTNRTQSDTTISAALAEIYGSDGPSVEDYRNGRAWNEVNHGSKGYAKSSYSDQWEWLNRVRTAAQKISFA